VSLNSPSITRFDCHAAVCLPYEVKECLWNQEATGTTWIGLEQNFVDIAVDEWRKRLFVCVRLVGHHFKQFYYSQLKNGQLDELSAKVSELWTKCVLRIMLIKQSYCIALCVCMHIYFLTFYHSLRLRWYGFFYLIQIKIDWLIDKKWYFAVCGLTQTLTNVKWGEKLNGHLMAIFVGNICTKIYQNLTIGF